MGLSSLLLNAGLLDTSDRFDDLRIGGNSGLGYQARDHGRIPPRVELQHEVAQRAQVHPLHLWPAILHAIPMPITPSEYD